MIILYGSQTSPYVRKLRLFFSLIGESYMLKSISLFEENQRKEVMQHNPISKIPYIKKGDEYLYDSRVIFNSYQSQKNSIFFENTLSMLEALNDSLIQKYLLMKSFSTEEVNQSYYGKLQNERVETLLMALNKITYSNWDYLSISLLCSVEWINFRQMWDLNPYDGLLAWYGQFKDREDVVSTRPFV